MCKVYELKLCILRLSKVNNLKKIVTINYLWRYCLLNKAVTKITAKNLIQKKQLLIMWLPFVFISISLTMDFKPCDNQ